MLPLPDGPRLSVGPAADGFDLRLDGEPLLRVRRHGAGADEVLEPLEWPAQGAAVALEALAYWCFAADPQRQRLRLRLAEVPAELLASGLLMGRGEDLRVERAAFWQLPGGFLRAGSSAGYPQRMNLDATTGRRHPLRPPKPEGEVYRRFDARLGAWISLRSLALDTDLARFNRWQNSPRVAKFWQEEGDLDRHRAYLLALAEDPRVLTLLGCLDDEPFAYFEAYWAKEDRIAPFYGVDDYDRGIHMLVGEEHHRGPHKVTAWLGALSHYLFLDEPRTQRVVAEPRADNARMIQHMQTLGFYREKAFDFPHKRAALMMLQRETFFDRCVLA
ncbi:GNAT family N-acetyltransferase [Pseudomonas alcaligenes]|uniref:GNAT family N-acetyltransferase n=1 Tax=Pseudomonas sp. RIT-PI-AD TaxID=3035294 RepID=UPI0021DB5159